MYSLISFADMHPLPTAWYGRIRGSISTVLAYLNTFYFLEIIYVMISVNMLFGRLFASALAVSLALALSAQIILLYFRNPVSRHLQLLIMELHAAYSIPLFVNFIAGSFSYHPLDSALIILRFLSNCVEVACIYVLTDEAVKTAFE